MNTSKLVSTMNGTSTYAKCDCGEEILEFLTFEDLGDPYFYLSLHGQLTKYGQKLYSKGKERNWFQFFNGSNVLDFCRALKNSFALVLVDDEVPGYLEVDADAEGEGCTIRKWGKGKYLDKHRDFVLFGEGKDRSLEKCIWELCLSGDAAKAFADNILEIMKDLSKKAGNGERKGD